MCIYDYVAGSVFVYSKTGSSWSSQGKIQAKDGGSYDYFGSSVSLFASSALVGADYDDDKGYDSGE